MYKKAGQAQLFAKLVPATQHGEVAEWSIAAVLKTAEPQGSGGSNPSLSATLLDSSVVAGKARGGHEVNARDDKGRAKRECEAPEQSSANPPSPPF